MWLNRCIAGGRGPEAVLGAVLGERPEVQRAGPLHGKLHQGAVLQFVMNTGRDCMTEDLKLPQSYCCAACERPRCTLCALDRTHHLSACTAAGARIAVSAVHLLNSQEHKCEAILLHRGSRREGIRHITVPSW